MKYEKNEDGTLKLDDAGDPIPIADPKDKKPEGGVNMTQEALDGLMDKAYARGATNSADAKKLQALQTENEELKKAAKKLADAKKKGPKDNESGDDFDERITALTEGYEEKLGAIQTQLDTEKTARAEEATKNQLSALETVVVAGAGKKNAVDPQEVFVLMQSRGYFKQDPDNDGKWAPVNPKTGKIRIDVDEGGDTMSIEKSVDEFMDQHAHLMRGSRRSGSGQGDDHEKGDRDVPSPNGISDVTQMKPSEVFANRRGLVQHIAAGGKGGVVGSQTVDG